MPPVNDPSKFARRSLLAAGLGFALTAIAAPGQAADDKKKKKDDPNTGQPLRPPINSPLLQVEAVTMPVAGPPERTMILTFTLECKDVETARKVDEMHPRFYNAVILELNREPIGANGRVTDRDLESLKRRLLFQINRALKGPTIEAVYIRSMQEVPRSGRS